MKAYTIMYKKNSWELPEMVQVLAENKYEAYDHAVYDLLGGAVYSAWVYSVTYNNGNYHRFNTCEGKRF